MRARRGGAARRAQIDRLPPAQPAKFAALVLHEDGKGKIALTAASKTSQRSSGLRWSRQPDLNRRPAVYESALPRGLLRPPRCPRVRMRAEDLRGRTVVARSRVL